jgi:putative FmdB family regulatory protein
MPIYEYICLDCENEFELLRAMAQADAGMACSECGGEKIKRKLSVFFAESGGKAVSGMTEPSCAGCESGNCSHCGH